MLLLLLVVCADTDASFIPVWIAISAANRALSCCFARAVSVWRLDMLLRPDLA
jgi:hypothetical protein